MLNASRDEWLVRTAQNFLAGPYSREQLILLLQEKQLGLQDEICPANGYWVYLHEREEVRRLLGVDIPRGMSRGDDDEITETQDVTARIPVPTPESAPMIDPLLTESSPEEQTAMLINAALRNYQGGPGTAVLSTSSKISASQRAGMSHAQASSTSVTSGRLGAPRAPAQVRVYLGMKERSSWKRQLWLWLVGVLVLLIALARLSLR